MLNKLNVSVSDVKHIETKDVSACFATVRIGGRKRRVVSVKTSKEFKQKIMAKISEYSKNRQK